MYIICRSVLRPSEPCRASTVSEPKAALGGKEPATVVGGKRVEDRGG